MDIFEALRQDHKKQRTLMSLLTKTRGDSKDRSELFEKLKKELQDHAAEERYFYVPLIEADLTQDKARHSIAEHHELDELIEDLEQTDMSSPRWLATATKLEDRLLHHLEEEEREMFQLAGKVLSDEQKSSLVNGYREEMHAES